MCEATYEEQSDESVLCVQVVPSVAFKVCKKCTEEKPAGEFPRNKLTNDGLHTYCK